MDLLHITLACLNIYICSNTAVATTATYDRSSSLSVKEVHQCVPVDIPQCRQWYDRRRPHDIYTSTTTELKMVKDIVANLELLKKRHPKCVSDATFLLCSLYSPVCIKGSKLLEPCRELCVEWKSKCHRLPIFNSVALPDKLNDCKELPEYHSSMCIKPTTFFTKEQENKKTKSEVGSTDGSQEQPCKCQDFKQNQPKYRHFRKASYVFEATINTRETLANGNTKIILNVQKIYKRGKINLQLGKLRMWSSCLCQTDIKYGDKTILLVAESTHQKKKHLEVNRSTFILPYQKYEIKLSRWHSKCVRRRNCPIL